MTDLTAGQPSLALGDILNGTVALLGANAIRVVPALLGMMAIAVALDLGWARSELEALAGIVSLLLQYWLTASLLKDLKLRSASRPRFIAFFLLILATSIGIGVGFVFLIVPGVLFLVRWSIASPAIVASDARVFEAIEYSWRATKPHAWNIFGAMLVIYAPAVVVGIVILSQGEPGTVLAAIIMELAINASLVGGWHFSIVVYAELQRSTLYPEVFA
jgi:hypothetical protein